MSTITIGSAPLELTGSASTRSAVSTDPDAFAAELQSATDATTADATTADATGAGPTAPASVAPAGPTQPGSMTATPIAATVTAQPAGPAIVAAPPASAGSQPASAQPASAQPDSALPDSAEVVSAQPDAIAADSAAAATSPAPSVLSPTPGAHRGPKHASTDATTNAGAGTDAVPAPMPAVTNPIALAAAGLPAAMSTAVPSASVSLPAAQTSDDELPALAAAVGASAPSPLGTGTAPVKRAADVTDSGRATDSPRPAQVPAAPVPILPTLAVSAPVAATAAVGNAQRPVARITTDTAGNAQALAAVVAPPAVSHASAADAPSAPTPPQAAPPLNEQLAPPLLALRTAGGGTHVLTITVSPDSVGPVTVRAHVTGDTMRVELSAPTDQGTDALKSMLPDLRRDLSQGGVNSALTIASPGSDGSAAGNQNAFGGAGGSFARDERPNYFRNASPASLPATVGSPRPISVGATSALDVFA